MSFFAHLLIYNRVGRLEVAYEVVLYTPVEKWTEPSGVILSESIQGFNICLQDDGVSSFQDHRSFGVVDGSSTVRSDKRQNKKLGKIRKMYIAYLFAN